MSYGLIGILEHTVMRLVGATAKVEGLTGTRQMKYDRSDEIVVTSLIPSCAYAQSYTTQALTSMRVSKGVSIFTAFGLTHCLHL